MQTPSLNLDRLGVALKALRQTHDPDPENKIGLGVKCLAVLIHQLAKDGLAQEDLQPLIDLEACLQNRHTTERRETVPNRRRGGAPSEAVLARIAAVIDVLVKAGHEEAEAAQMLMRRMCWPPASRRRSRAGMRAAGNGCLHGGPTSKVAWGRRRLATNIRLSRGSWKGFRQPKG
jgi:hypothetical protein